MSMDGNYGVVSKMSVMLEECLYERLWIEVISAVYVIFSIQSNLLLSMREINKVIFENSKKA